MVRAGNQVKLGSDKAAAIPGWGVKKSGSRHTHSLEGQAASFSVVRASGDESSRGFLSDSVYWFCFLRPGELN